MRVDWIPVAEGLPDGSDDVLVTVQRPDEGDDLFVLVGWWNPIFKDWGGVRRGLGETAVQHHRLGTTAGTVRRRKEKMLTAKCNYDKQGIDCEVEGTTMEIVGELTAMIRAVQEALIKKYDKDGVDETIVNIGRAAYNQKPQDVANICRPLIGKRKQEVQKREQK